MRRSRARAAAWLAVIGLALAGGLGSTRSAPGRSATARLLGPIASLAASVQWVRFDAALNDGRPDLAYTRARLALELDPGGTEGWSYLGGQHFARQRGSAEVSESPEQRAAWIRVGLDVLRRGEGPARAPEDLAVEQGLILVTLGDSELAGAWPGGRRAAYAEAVSAFERAQANGHPLGPELVELARQALEQGPAREREPAPQTPPGESPHEQDGHPHHHGE